MYGVAQTRTRLLGRRTLNPQAAKQVLSECAIPTSRQNWLQIQYLNPLPVARAPRFKALTHPNDALVSRRSTGKTPLIAKLSEDVWSLSHSLKNSYNVPHSVLRNGKRSETYLNLARTQSQNLSQGPALECQHRNLSQIPRQNQSQSTPNHHSHLNRQGQSEPAKPVPKSEPAKSEPA